MQSNALNEHMCVLTSSLDGVAGAPTETPSMPYRQQPGAARLHPHSGAPPIKWDGQQAGVHMPGKQTVSARLS